jgi:hypothetical protein
VLAEHVQLPLAGRLTQGQPADDQIQVPAHPGADVPARGVKALEGGLLPEAVEHPVGEHLEIGALDDPPEYLAATERLHVRIVHLHSPRRQGACWVTD